MQPNAFQVNGLMSHWIPPPIHSLSSPLEHSFQMACSPVSITENHETVSLTFVPAQQPAGLISSELSLGFQSNKVSTQLSFQGLAMRPQTTQKLCDSQHCHIKLYLYYLRIGRAQLQQQYKRCFRRQCSGDLQMCFSG